MERILSELQNAADGVKILEDKRHRLGLFLRDIKGAQIEQDAEILEDRMVVPVEPDPLKRLRVAGVDGGLVKKAYHAVDLILTRAVAAVFDY